MWSTVDGMKFGFVVPWGDADDVGDLAAAAEEADWDGLFVWEPIWGVDAWISLEGALDRRGVEASEPTEFYLVGLLGDYAKARLPDGPLSLRLADTGTLASSKPRRRARRV